MDKAPLHPIRNETDYRQALAEIEAFDDSTYEAGTLASDRMDVLAILVGAYEQGEIPIPDVDPVGILHYAIADLGRSEADLARLVGSEKAASDILNRRRRLTLEMIWAIHDAWKLPLGCLAGRYEVAAETAPQAA